MAAEDPANRSSMLEGTAARVGLVVLSAVVLLAAMQGVVALFVLALLAVLVWLVVVTAVAVARAVQGTADEGPDGVVARRSS